MISTKSLVLVPLALALAACGSLPFGSAARPTPTSNLFQEALAYSQCMRSHGVPDFPDPDPSGGIAITSVPNSDLDPGSAAFQTAANACHSLEPSSKSGRRGGVSQADRQKFLAYSACMRSHGMPDFPDPTFNHDGIQITIKLNPSSPAYQAADQACRSLLPNSVKHVPPGAGAQHGSGGPIRVGAGG